MVAITEARELRAAHDKGRVAREGEPAGDDKGREKS
jgi:hypothetical protein